MIHTAMNRQDLHQFPSRIEFYYSRAVARHGGVSHCATVIQSCSRTLLQITDVILESFYKVVILHNFDNMQCS